MSFWMRYSIIVSRYFHRASPSDQLVTGNDCYDSQGKDIGMLPDIARLFKTVGFPAAFGLVLALMPTPKWT
jgi:hypothetical protein